MVFVNYTNIVTLFQIGVCRDDYFLKQTVGRGLDPAVQNEYITCFGGVKTPPYPIILVIQNAPTNSNLLNKQEKSEGLNPR